MVNYVSVKKVLGYLSRSSILVPKNKVYHENYNSWELDDGGRVKTADRDTRFHLRYSPRHSLEKVISMRGHPSGPDGLRDVTARFYYQRSYI